LIEGWQDGDIWKKFLGKDMVPKNNMTELYFEEAQIIENCDSNAAKETGIVTLLYFE